MKRRKKGKSRKGVSLNLFQVMAETRKAPISA
jgi:hypothetical protein